LFSPRDDAGLPSRFAADPEGLVPFPDDLPHEERATAKVSDPSWHCAEAYPVLKAQGAAFAPSAGRAGTRRRGQQASGHAVYVVFENTSEAAAAPATPQVLP